MCTDCKPSTDFYGGKVPSVEIAKVEREREIPSAINLLEHRIENLDRALSMLSDKLSPIVNMKTGVAEKNKPVADIVPTSAMGEKLVALSNYVLSIHSKVTELRDVVEI